MRYAAGIALAALWVVPAAGAEKKKDKVAENRYYLEVEHPGNDVSIYINKVLYDVQTEKDPFHYTQITPFLKKGRNQVSLIWKNVSPLDRSVSLAVWEAAPGVPKEKAKRLLIYNPKKGLYRGESSRRTFGFIAKIPIEWSWLKTRRVRRLSEEDREELGALLARLHDRFAAKDAAKVVAILKTMFLDMDFNKDRVLKKARRHYAACMSDPDWAMEPFPSQAIEFETYGRLVRASTRGAVIAARELKKCGRIAFHAVYFAKLKDGWTIVRAN